MASKSLASSGQRVSVNAKIAAIATSLQIVVRKQGEPMMLKRTERKSDPRPGSRRPCVVTSLPASAHGEKYIFAHGDASGGRPAAKAAAKAVAKAAVSKSTP
jgi:hypothetical protein